MGFIKRFKKKRKKLKKQQFIENTIKTLIPDFTVQHGPFKGLKYPELKSVCSCLFPKLIGSYEAELHDVVNSICNKNYTEIVDIGCAEGYYAVGLAMRIPTANMYIYDTDKEAVNLCKKMAECNGINPDRFHIGDFCDTDALKAIPFTGKGLIVSDCEGYEKELFTPEMPEFLKNHDLLIETHDLFDITITTYLYEIFNRTHDIEVIQSIDDIQKAKTYNYAELSDYSLEIKRTLLAEERPSILEWFYIKSRH